MLSTLLHLAPAALPGRRCAKPILARIDRDLRGCDRTASAIHILSTFKPDLFFQLSSRFRPPLAKALAVKILNLLLAKFHSRARSALVLSRPIGLIIDPSNMCQLACPGCVHSTRSKALNWFDWQKGTLLEERFAALLRLYGPYAIGVYFCNYGEPLLNLDTPKLIRLAKTYLLGVGLSTSLSVRKFDADAYVESGLDFMVLSIDGATQPVYERFRRGGSLALVLENVRQMVSAKRRLKKRTPVLSWNFIAFEHNANESPTAAQMARQLGVEQFRIVPPYDVTWDDPDMRAAKLNPAIRRLERLVPAYPAENWNPFPRSLQEFAFARAFDEPWFDTPWIANEPENGPTQTGHTCGWLYKNLVMDATGRILPCSCAPRPDANLVFTNFDGGRSDPFNSEKHRQARAWFASETKTPNSPYCTECAWDQNRVDIGAPEIRRYFRAADAAYFDRESVRILSDW